MRNVLHYLILFLPIKTRLFLQSRKCGQLSYNYIKRDLVNPNFSSESIVIPLFSCTTSCVHIFKLRLQGYSYTRQEPPSSHIHTYSYSYLKKVAIGKFLNLLFDSTGEILFAGEIFNQNQAESSGLICHYGVDLMHPHLSKKNPNQSCPNKVMNKYVNTLDALFK